MDVGLARQLGRSGYYSCPEMNENADPREAAAQANFAGFAFMEHQSPPALPE
jgi:hypothetical protein